MLATRSDEVLTCPDGRRHEAQTLAALTGPTPGSDARLVRARPANGSTPKTMLPVDPAGLPDGGRHWLLVRRQITLPPQTTPGKDPKPACYHSAGPTPTRGRR